MLTMTQIISPDHAAARLVGGYSYPGSGFCSGRATQVDGDVPHAVFCTVTDLRADLIQENNGGNRQLASHVFSEEDLSITSAISIDESAIDLKKRTFTYRGELTDLTQEDFDPFLQNPNFDVSLCVRVQGGVTFLCFLPTQVTMLIQEFECRDTSPTDGSCDLDVLGEPIIIPGTGQSTTAVCVLPSQYNLSQGADLPDDGTRLVTAYPPEDTPYENGDNCKPLNAGQLP
jgi:hypothetical protein